jgi:hypothetical protein
MNKRSDRTSSLGGRSQMSHRALVSDVADRAGRVVTLGSQGGDLTLNTLGVKICDQ